MASRAPSQASRAASSSDAPVTETRKVVINNRADTLEKVKQDKARKFNSISTGKYNVVTFIPKNLFEQFQRIANVYFLILLLLQLYPPISSLDWQSTFVPLFFVLTVTALKDGYDDYKRHMSDRQINNRVTLRLRKQGNGRHTWQKVKWASVEVGDILKIKSNDGIPADCVLLSSALPAGECYVETADLDGETNLKRKETHPDSHGYLTSQATNSVPTEEVLGALTGIVKYDMPNTNLDKFQGSIEESNMSPQKMPLKNKNLLLRGCILRNTEFAIGVAVYCGADTKVMRNTGLARFKRTHIDYEMNRLVITIFALLGLFSGVAAIMNRVWLKDKGLSFIDAYNWFFLEDSNEFENARFTDPDTIAGLQFLSYIIVMNTLIPISLYVSVEFIRLGQSLLISYDPLMWDNHAHAYAQARSTTLTEELGQIDYVFSDKTGTLTQNVMVFQNASINGKVYGISGEGRENVANLKELEDEDGNTKAIPPELQGFHQEMQRMDKEWSALGVTKTPRPEFIDKRFLGAIKEQDEGVLDFFRLMAVCHTVRPDHKPDGSVEYQAESPDEKALVDASRLVGLEFVDNIDNHVQVRVGKEVEIYDLLHIIEFDSTRKRMSVIVRDRQENGQVKLYSKGADSIMFERLHEDEVQLKNTMQSDLDNFANEGLRTLVMAKKNISEEEYKEWSERYHEAETAVDDRDEKMEALADEIERGLYLVGASAIEDKLQDHVPVTIEKLKEGGIKVWVLTGDKLETAMNIGASCRLLTPEMKPYFIIDSETYEGVRSQILDATSELARRKADYQGDKDNLRFAVVITGPALTFPLHPSAKELQGDLDQAKLGGQLYWTEKRLAEQEKLELEFLALAKQCSAVLCCRVSLLQKAKVVDTVKTREKAITLAIGDGANDVSMIKTAHIGVGISGLEGRQAVLASDYSIGQFQFLGRLLLVHGRWSYYRMCRFLRYFFYKNFVFTVAQFWFAFYNGASAMTDFDALFISFFNVVYASAPIVVIAVIEQDVSAKMSYQFPMLYKAGPKNVYFSQRGFYFDLARGTFHSALMFFAIVLAIRNGGQADVDGQEQGDLRLLGIYLSFSLVMIVNIQLLLEVKHWTWIHGVSFLVGPFSWFFLLGLVYGWEDQIFQFVSKFFGAFDRALEGEFFWVTVVITIVICTLPNVMYMCVQQNFFPTPMDAVRKYMLSKEAHSAGAA